MADSLNVLLLEDRLDDAELVLIALRTAGFAPQWRRVDSKEEYLRHLTPELDIILADYQLPQFTGLEALQLLQARGLDIPFIIVTGTYEEDGLRCMKMGAADYLLKDRLSRLGEAVRHALDERILRQKKQEAEAAEREEHRFAEALADTAVILNSTLDLDELLDRVLENIKKVIPHDAAGIILLEGGKLHLARHNSQHNAAIIETSLRYLDKSNLLDSVKMGQTIAIPDTKEEPTWYTIPGLEWIRSEITAPLFLQDTCLGFIVVVSKTANFYTQKYARWLNAFTAHVVTALQNARLYAELENYNEILEQAVQARTQELHTAFNELQTILDNSPDPILLVKPNGKIETGNPAFKEIFGYEFADISAKGMLTLIAPESATRFMDTMAQVLSTGERRRVEIMAQNKDGRQLDIDLALAPVAVAGQELPLLVCSLRDITALKEVQRMKEAFVSNVSHELRTPISVLLLYHGTLSMRPDKFVELKDKIAREIKRLTLIIEDLLRLSRLDQGQVKLEQKPVDLNELAAEGVSDRQILAQHKELTLSFTPGEEKAIVKGDFTLLGQVLNILLTNALNYTPTGGHIKVTTVHWAAVGHPLIGFSVQDNGPGIPLPEQAKLFDRFYRGSAGRDSNAPGTGLGLTIAQEIVSRHQGQITVDSLPGEGSTFTVWLPAPPEAAL